MVKMPFIRHMFSIWCIPYYIVIIVESPILIDMALIVFTLDKQTFIENFHIQAGFNIPSMLMFRL